MLEVLKRKAQKLGLKPKVYRADMRNFRLKEKFGLIIIPFRSFLHNLTIEDQLKTLKNVKKHLLPRGKFILNFFYPNPEVMLKVYGKWEKEIIKVNNERCELESYFRFIDQVNQIIENKDILKKNGKTIWKGEFKLAFIYKREFELLLKLAGFKKYRVYGGFNYEPLKSWDQEMVWIVEK